VIPERLVQRATALAADGVLIVDADGRIVYANRSMHDLTLADDLVGTSVDELVPDVVRGRHARYRAAYAGAPVQRPMGTGLDLALRRIDGTHVPVEISLSPFDDDDGLYVVASIRDISERRATEQRLAATREQLALVSERERIGRDLHDVVLQHLYGLGLSVQAIAAGADAVTSVRLEDIVDEVDKVIAEVRTIVFTLGSAASHGGLAQELAEIIAQATRVLGFTPGLVLDGPVESVLTDAVRSELYATLREALGNIARHAGATQAEVSIAVVGDELVARVADNGIGPPGNGIAPGGHGLVNLAARARDLRGVCTLERGATSGAVLTWRVPF
jgi:PAS domain S-box-containing protein